MLQKAVNMATAWLKGLRDICLPTNQPWKQRVFSFFHMQE
jgi:hypothetical protein